MAFPAVVLPAAAFPVTAGSGGGGGVPLAALVPFIVLAVAFIGYCLVDLARNDVRYLPKWAWLIICLVSVPMGGIIYLIFGRRPR